MAAAKTTRKLALVAMTLTTLFLTMTVALPIDDPAAGAAPSIVEPVVAPVAVEPVVAPVASAPIVETIPVAAAPIAAAPVAATQPAVLSPGGAGNGYITEHKSPDGSTLTITRFNGQIPASAFNINPFGFSTIQQNLYQPYYQNQFFVNRHLRNLYNLQHQLNLQNYQLFASSPFQNTAWSHIHQQVGGPFGSPYGPAIFNPWGYFPVAAAPQLRSA